MLRKKTSPLHLIIIFTNQYYYHFDLPKGIFRWNQLLDSSMSLSPLYSNMTSNLHVNTAWFLHQSFLRLQTVQVQFTIFRVLTCLLHPVKDTVAKPLDFHSHSFSLHVSDSIRSHSHPCQTPWSVFQDGQKIHFLRSPAVPSRLSQDLPRRPALPNIPVHNSSAPQDPRITPQTQHTGNLTIKPISCSQSLPRPKSRHQLRLAIMLPHHLTPSSRTLPTPFSRIFRSHNTLSSSFHSFFKVLLSFPSQYFFAIGFPVIFRL